jgi:hypothetical protein
MRFQIHPVLCDSKWLCPKYSLERNMMPFFFFTSLQSEVSVVFCSVLQISDRPLHYLKVSSPSSLVLLIRVALKWTWNGTLTKLH